MESACFFASRYWVEQHFRATEPFGVDSGDVTRVARACSSLANLNNILSLVAIVFVNVILAVVHATSDVRILPVDVIPLRNSRSSDSCCARLLNGPLLGLLFCMLLGLLFTVVGYALIVIFVSCLR